MPPSSRPLRIGLVVALAGVLAVAACGRRGSPVLPPGERAPPGTIAADPDRPNGPRVKQDTTFILDPLL